MGQSFACNTPTLTTSWKTNLNKPSPYEEKLTTCLIAILEFGGRVEGLKEKKKKKKKRVQGLRALSPKVTSAIRFKFGARGIWSAQR